jgi:uncharacterized protein (DUF488 family)
VRLWSVGHSTHSLEALVALLAASEIEVLADVRTVPRSRRLPHVNREALEHSLPGAGLRYVHLPRLGGWRRAVESSPNGAWRNASFRGYADYALTEAFADGLDELCTLARGSRTAMMCSEALWWRCHRRLIADRLVVAGWTVLHIGSVGRTSPHELPPFAVVRPDRRVTYPVPEAS